MPLKAVSGTHFLVGRTLAFVGNEKVPAQPPSNGPAWTRPPGSLTTPTVIGASPAGYSQIFTSRSNPLQWMTTFSAMLGASNRVTWPNWQGAPGQSQFDFYLVALDSDDEGVGFASWVNIQPYVHQTGPPVLWGNMQPEFR